MRFPAAPLRSPLPDPADGAAIELPRRRSGCRATCRTADHGHVVDYEGTYSSAGGGAERWRPATEHAGDSEVVLAGKRVLAGDGRVIAPWTERVRCYTTGKSAGYHGGATPQEMLVPVAVRSLRGGRTGVRIPGGCTCHSRAVGQRTSPAARPAGASRTDDADVSPPEPAWIAEPRLPALRYAARTLRYGPRRMTSVFGACLRPRRAVVARDCRRDCPGDRRTGASSAGRLAGLRRVLAVDGFDVLSVRG